MCPAWAQSNGWKPHSGKIIAEHQGCPARGEMKTPTYIIQMYRLSKLDFRSNFYGLIHYLMVYVGVFTLYRLKVAIYMVLMGLFPVSLSL